MSTVLVEEKEKSVTGPQTVGAKSVDFEGKLSNPGEIPWAQTVRKMRKHPTVKLARFLSIAPALAAEWAIEFDDEIDEAKRDEITKEVKRQIFPHRAKLLEQAFFGMIDFGWAPFELVWSPDWTLQDIKSLLQELTDILADKADGSFRGFYQAAQGESQAVTLKLEEGKVCLFNQNVEGTDWYGQGDSQAAEDHWNSALITEATARKYDRKTAGAHWWVQYPAGQTMYEGTLTDNGLIADSILAQLVANGSISTPRTADRLHLDMDVGKVGLNNDAWSIELIESTGTTSSSLNDRSRYLDAQIVRAYLQPERTMTEGKFGTKAESGEQQDLALTVVAHRLKLFLEALNRYVTNQVVVLFFGEDMRDKVKIISNPIEDEKQKFFRELYREILKTPDGALIELGQVDMDALREAAGVPSLPKAEAGMLVKTAPVNPDDEPIDPKPKETEPPEGT